VMKPTNLEEYTLNTLKTHVPGSIPGTGFPEMLRDLFRTHINSLQRFPKASQRLIYSVCEFLPGAFLLATFVAGVRGSCDRMDTGSQQSNVRLWRGTFLPISFDPAVRRYRPDLVFWQRVIKEKQDTSRVPFGYPD